MNEETQDFQRLIAKLRSYSFAAVMQAMGFVPKPERNTYLKRVGDLGMLVTTPNMEKMPDSWDEKIAISFVEFWTDEHKATYLYQHGADTHSAIGMEAFVVVMFGMSNENEILEWLKNHAPQEANSPVQP